MEETRPLTISAPYVNGTVTDVFVQHFTTEHTNVFVYKKEDAGEKAPTIVVNPDIAAREYFVFG